MRVTDTWSKLSSILLIVIAIASMSGCGGPPAPSDGAQQPASGPDGRPQLTKEVIDERINDAWVSGVKPENGTGNPITWSFDEDEPKELVIVDQQIDGTSAKIVFDVKTQSSPRATNQRVLSGQIRTEWELQTGWVLRRWEIVHTENISMTYRDVSKPPGAPPPLPNSNNSATGNNR